MLVPMTLGPVVLSPVVLMLGSVMLGSVMLGSIMLGLIMLGPVMPSLVVLGPVLVTEPVVGVPGNESAEVVTVSILVMSMVPATVRSPIWIWMITSVGSDDAFGNETGVGSVWLTFTFLAKDRAKAPPKRQEAGISANRRMVSL